MKSNSSPIRFFGLTFLLTWACWITAGLLSPEEYGTLITVLHYAGGIMPTLVTLLLLYASRDRQERRDYWQRLFDLKRINKAWYAVLLLTVPLITAAGVVFDLVLGGLGAELEAASNFIDKPLSLLPFVVFMLLFGPLPEEMAWRGYALDGLQKRWNALGASLVLGTAWTLWHLPLFLIDGSYQHSLGIGTSQFWLYMLDKIPQSVLMTWIYNNNRRSTASAVLFHFMVNFVGELFDLSLQAETITIAAWWMLAVIVVAIWKPQRLVRMKSSAYCPYTWV
jgi:membrane protease YdiL (CAAX protease family)